MVNKTLYFLAHTRQIAAVKEDVRYLIHELETVLPLVATIIRQISISCQSAQVKQSDYF